MISARAFDRFVPTTAIVDSMNAPVKSTSALTAGISTPSNARSLSSPSSPVFPSPGARDNGINVNQRFAWRKRFKAAEAGNGVVVATPVLFAVEAPVAGILRLEFAKARLTIEGKPDPELLRTVLELLNR